MSQSYDAQFFALQFDERCVPKAEVFALRPAAFVYFLGVVLHLRGDVEQVGKYHLGHRSCAVCRNVGDDDAPCLGGCDVYNVVARGKHADVFQRRQGGEVLCGNDCLVGQ